MSYLYNLIVPMLEGAIITLKVFSITLILSLPLGVIVALLRLSKIKPLSNLMQLYIWIMRGTPLLLQIIFVFFGLPLVGITFDRYEAVIIAFILNYAAYFGEIFRSGISAVDVGQYEAAKVLSMTPFKTFIRIVLPQMIKIVLPPASNEVISLVKDTSLVYVVGLSELLRVGEIASNRDASLIPLIYVGIIYLLMTGVLTKAFKSLEKSFNYYR